MITARLHRYILLLWLTVCTAASLSGQPRLPVPGPPDEEVVVDAGGFGGQSNGFTTAQQFASDCEDFEDIETAATGLGPLFNANSCVTCHNNPVSGGSSIVTELHAGSGVPFVPQTDTGLVHAQALDPSIQPRILAKSTRRGVRASPTLPGLGFVECLDSADLESHAKGQPPAQRGEVTLVTLLEAPDGKRVGRFGWKAQHASLVSFAADANRNELGRTSVLLPTRNFDPTDTRTFGRPPDPVDVGGDQGFGAENEVLARFMRSTRPPLPDPAIHALPEAQAGLALFRRVGCAVCHREQHTTLEPGSLINGGTFSVPAALGSKVIWPYSDFLLHDVGTGDGITQGGPQSTANKFRTPPLWGLRVKSRLMHDGASFTRHEAILRHGGQATTARANYLALTLLQKRQLQVFLRSL